MWSKQNNKNLNKCILYNIFILYNSQMPTSPNAHEKEMTHQLTNNVICLAGCWKVAWKAVTGKQAEEMDWADN